MISKRIFYFDRLVLLHHTWFIPICEKVKFFVEINIGIEKKVLSSIVLMNMKCEYGFTSGKKRINLIARAVREIFDCFSIA